MNFNLSKIEDRVKYTFEKYTQLNTIILRHERKIIIIEIKFTVQEINKSVGRNVY